MNKTYPKRIDIKNKTVVWMCTCGHTENQHTASIIDVLFRWNLSKPIATGHCDQCMCPKFEICEKPNGETGVSA